MTASAPLDPNPSRNIQSDTWKKTVAYFRDRGGVLFVSYCRFWDRHAFAQQSLAKLLVAEGVRVLWVDGAGWRRYHPVYPKEWKNLHVAQMPEFPGRRFLAFAELSIEMQLRWLKRKQRWLGSNPVVWIQAGLDERLAGSLPTIDVYSVFDDPYRHTPMGDLCRRAKVILCQNQRAFQALHPHLGNKVMHLLPPVELSPELGDPLPLPDGFPEKRMGYIGSFLSSGFDLVLFESFIRWFPEFGFVLIGRTDAKGRRYLDAFRKHPNFVHFNWCSKAEAEASWKQIDLSLLFYRPNQSQDGAFPIKFIEALRCGVPSIATEVPKTADLPDWVPKSTFSDELRRSVENALRIPKSVIRESFDTLAADSDPRLQLVTVAERLRALHGK